MDSPFVELACLLRMLTNPAEFNSFDNTPWILQLVDFTKQVLAQDRVRIIGVCFGHQIIARALGLLPSRNARGWELSVCSVNLEPEAQKAFGKPRLVRKVSFESA